MLIIKKKKKSRLLPFLLVHNNIYSRVVMVGVNMSFCIFMVSLMQQAYASIKVTSITYRLYSKVLVCLFLDNKFKILVLN